MDFKSSIEETSEATRSISIEIPREIYNTKFNKILNKTASSANLKGFRPGKAPRAHIQKLYGEQIHSDVIGDLISNAYQDVIKDKKLKVVGNPSFDIQDEDKEKDLTIKADVSIYPEPELKDYKGISFSYEPQIASDEEIEKRLNSICEQQSKIEEIKDRTKSNKGDIAIVDYEATVDGVAVPSACAKNIQIELGKEGVNEKVAKEVIGMEVGSVKTAQIELPENYSEELRKSPALYTITLNEIKTKTTPKLSDEVAKNSGLAEDLDGLKKIISENLAKETENINKTRKEEALLEAIFDKNNFEIPPALVDEEIRMMLFEFGIMNPQDRNSYSMDISRFREMFAEKATANAKRGVILNQLEAIEKPQVEDSAVDVWLDERASEESRTREEINQYYQFPEQLERIKTHVAKVKMVDDLLAQAKIKEVKEKKPKADKKTAEKKA